MRTTLIITCLISLLVLRLSGQDTCMVNGIFINAILIDPSGSQNLYDTNSDGSADSNDEYIELCNSTDQEVDVSGWLLGDDDPPPYADYMIPDETFIPSGGCILLVANYCVNFEEDCILPDNVLDMSFPFLGLLGNEGDAIQISNDQGDQCSVTYGNMTCEDVDALDLPGFLLEDCVYWGPDVDGCALLSMGDSCDFVPGPLPVELLSFNAKIISGQAVMLEWVTGSELNNSGFELQWKPSFENNFRKISWINSQEQSQNYNHYRYIHERPGGGTNYYRIKQIDYNGDYYYSEVLVIVFDLPEELRVFPTLVSSEIQVNGNDEHYLMSLYALNGKLIFDKIALSNNESLDLGSLTEGCYVLQIFNGRVTTNFRIIKI